jgi:hypothetical protein
MEAVGAIFLYNVSAETEEQQLLVVQTSYPFHQPENSVCQQHPLPQ